MKNNNNAKNILLIGIGGTGSSAVEILYRKINEARKENQDALDNHIVTMVFDTNEADIGALEGVEKFPMADNDKVGTIVDQIGRAKLKEWFPVDVPQVRNQEMRYGASQWRKKSYLAFLNLMERKDNLREHIKQQMELLCSKYPNAPIEIYTVSSLAGGTGSGSFIPITLYVKRYIKEVLKKDAIAHAFLACPDIYESKQTDINRTKIYANAYAIMRELNAINQVTHGYNDPKNNTEHHAKIRFKIGNVDTRVGLLFDA